MRMDQEPDIGDEPLPPPTLEEDRAEAWEYWHQRALKAEAELFAARQKLASLRTNVNECPSCHRMFKDGETCGMGGCPMGGDV